MKRILGALLALLVITPFATTVAFAQLVLSPPKFEFDAEPGQIISDTISITNKGSSTLTLNSVVEDFVAAGETGDPTFVDAGNADPAISMINWVRVNDGAAVEIAPGRKANIPFTISVPADAEPGGHYGAIFLQPPTGTGQVGIGQRIGALVLVRVKGEIVEDGRLDTFGSFAEDIAGEEIPEVSSRSFYAGLPVPFAVRYENMGNIHLKPQGQIRLYGTFGQELSEVGVVSIVNQLGVEIEKKIVDYVPVNDARGNVLARSFRTFRSEWNGTPYWYKHEDGTKEIRYKGFPVGAYRAELTLAGAGGLEVTENVRFVVFPWKEIGGGLLLAALLIFGGMKLSRYRAAAAEAAFKKKYGVQ